ncbi:TFIIB-type zinc ribbon-containing protein [Pseudoclavibacter chungangensis]|uniref:TFIIB-type zinc ribbon-containing protein n=1 Tax=Pseudoclavibacter chungangensis TaxID=587635 RepID=A0A7J5C285_9MICO|nr:TFIIB-type zinc ribbon-containing protein [Pseudoclavibacter chungangensis]
MVYEQHDGPTVIDTAAGSGDGIRKCPSCGSSDIQLDIPSGMLVCHFCRHAWSTPLATEAFHLDTPIGDLRGRVIGSGSQNIVPGTDQVVSFKCAACGAEISIDTNHAMQARCPWCRNTLSINEQMPNGAVPDVVLPFSLPKDAAVERIGAFVKKRRFFANRRFIREFSPENVLGVYLPYMIVDVNANLTFEGEGEHTTRTYTVSVGKDETERRFDYDVYRVGRRFSLHVDDLTLESASDKRDQDASRNTNNIINSIMPFDTKNAVVYDANYLAGFSSQRRDVDVDALYEPAAMQTEDIGRYRSLDTISFYDRGVRWDRRDVEIMGERWIAAYLPVWLYSYQEEKSGGRKLLHYIAVNGRTGETMGSVPLNMTRLWVFTGIAEVLGVIAAGLSALILW